MGRRFRAMETRKAELEDLWDAAVGIAAACARRDLTGARFLIAPYLEDGAALWELFGAVVAISARLMQEAAAGRGEALDDYAQDLAIRLRSGELDEDEQDREAPLEFFGWPVAPHGDAEEAVERALLDAGSLGATEKDLQGAAQEAGGSLASALRRLESAGAIVRAIEERPDRLGRVRPQVVWRLA